MKRREFVSLIGGAAAWPIAARAQQAERLARIGYLGPTSASQLVGAKPFLKQIQLGGEATGTAIKPVRISNKEEFESAFAAMETDRPDAVIVQPSLPSKRAAELALQHRVPAVSVPPWFVDEGGLMSYSPIYADLFRKAAVYVDKILQGAQPADLPVEQPTRFQLVINMKTAKALGITVPPALLARADELIE